MRWKQTQTLASHDELLPSCLARSEQSVLVSGSGGQWTADPDASPATGPFVLGDAKRSAAGVFCAQFLGVAR